MRAAILHTDGRVEHVNAPDEFDARAAWLREQVGGPLEAITLTRQVTAWLNEDGKHQRLPVNRVATRLARGRLARHDVIVGPAVLLGHTPDGDDTDLPGTDPAVTALAQIVSRQRC